MINDKLKKSLDVTLDELKKGEFSREDLEFLGKFFRSLFDITRAILRKIE